MTVKGWVWKILVLIVMFLFLGVELSSSNPARDQINPSLLMSGDGNTLYVGGGGPNNYSRIQYAIDNASVNDTIFVYDESSPYYENILVDTSINLNGENRETTIIDGSINGNVVNVTADWVNIIGFTIQNSGQGSWTGGIRLSSNNNTIIGNILSNNNDGICLFNSAYTTIKDNLIKDNIIWNNNKSGINIYGYGNKNTIDSNNISNNENHGIRTWGSDNTINRNSISNNGQTGIYLARCSSNTIIDNIISNNDEHGIQFYSANYNTIEGNNILNNYVGLYISGSDFNKITNNNISLNFRGIEIRDRSLGWDKYDESKRNKCFRNNIISNNESAYFVYFSIFRGNTWRYNYWDRPRLLPKFILGEMLSNTWFNIDWRPALIPYDIDV